FNPRGSRIGSSGAERNFIYSNGRHGINISASVSSDRPLLGNNIDNCFIGLNSAGTTDLGNGQNGIYLFQAHGNTIHSCVISGNNNDGIQISGAQAHGNVVTSNLIGLSAAGNSAIGNGASGVA